MNDNSAIPTTIDAYIAAQTPAVQPYLHELRRIIREAAPDTEEKISWAMPTFALYGNVIHFAACANHAGLYPGADGVAHFLDQLDGYKTSKGGIQLPYKNPIPTELIQTIVRYRVAQNIQEWEKKKL